MHPWLLHTDVFRLPTYFTCLMIGMALASGVLRREALRGGLDHREVMNAALLALPAALAGARVMHVLVEAPAYYWSHPLQVLSPMGGWVFYGGALGGVLAVAGWARWRGLDPWQLLDVFSVATAFGLVFGRIGCLGGGCCYGRVADWPFGVVVPWAVRYYRRGQIPEDLLSVPLHPTPLYAVAIALALFVFLSFLRGRQRFGGEVLLAFLVLYGLGRSAAELFRADVERGLFFGGLVSTSQLLGLTTAAVAAATWWIWARRCTPSSST
ncbi:MAG: prolipoprotein diacylglyceryl transferase [Deltaproteobacteria bacterium]|nr:prolipoprotein diacylglyceryl transferase [Deltaproteobacteria bacterium]MBW2254036.1 prolipoprotein diacylglyceryl transferase [Deltaproteobacteria bacterium]